MVSNSRLPEPSRHVSVLGTDLGLSRVDGRKGVQLRVLRRALLRPQPLRVGGGHVPWGPRLPATDS